jgi:hypothetical protein
MPMLVSYGTNIKSNKLTPLEMVHVINDIQGGRWKNEIEAIRTEHDKKKTE